METRTTKNVNGKNGSGSTTAFKSVESQRVQKAGSALDIQIENLEALLKVLNVKPKQAIIQCIPPLEQYY